MTNGLTRRIKFWKVTFYSKIRAGVGIVIAIATPCLILRDAVLDPKLQAIGLVANSRKPLQYKSFKTASNGNNVLRPLLAMP